IRLLRRNRPGGAVLGPPRGAAGERLAPSLRGREQERQEAGDDQQEEPLHEMVLAAVQRWGGEWKATIPLGGGILEDTEGAFPLDTQHKTPGREGGAAESSDSRVASVFRRGERPPRVSSAPGRAWHRATTGRARRNPSRPRGLPGRPPLGVPLLEMRLVP